MCGVFIGFVIYWRKSNFLFVIEEHQIETKLHSDQNSKHQFENYIINIFDFNVSIYKQDIEVTRNILS